MRSRIIAIMVVIALLLCVAVVAAQRGKQAGKPAGAPAMGAPGQGCGMGAGMACERIKKELGLTPDQVKEIQAICADCKASTQGAREDIQAMMKQMLALWMMDTPDAAAIKDLAAQMDSARAQIRSIAIDHALSAFAVLNADQKAKVRAFVGKNPGMCMGICGGPGMGCGMGASGMGCGMGQGKGPGAGMGCGMGQGKGPGAAGGKCPFAK